MKKPSTTMQHTLELAHHNSHEIKRYLTHLQSFVFLAKTSLNNDKKEQAIEFLNQHDESLQMASKLIESSFGLLYDSLGEQEKESETQADQTALQAA